MPDRPRAGLALLTLLCGLAGCEPAPTPTLPPAPQRLAVVPGLEAFATQAFTAWSEEAGIPDFDLEIWPESAALEAAERGDVAAVVTALSPPEGWFAAPVGVEAVGVIVNPENALRAFTPEGLAGLFSGRALDWQEFGGPSEPVQPVIPLPGDGLRAVFEAGVMEGSPLSGGALLAPSAEAALTLVAEDPGAIGLVPYGAADGRVRLVRVDGILPGEDSLRDGRYPLRATVLVVAPEEPSGAIREWIAWLQAASES
jgi:phosphate transport system substrate-binding protein